MYINNRRQIIGLIIILILLISSLHLKAQETDLDNFIIVIDAGHGGNDSGCSGYLETKEKDITLNLTKRLQDILLGGIEAKILLTRDKDRSV